MQNSLMLVARKSNSLSDTINDLCLEFIVSDDMKIESCYQILNDISDTNIRQIYNIDEALEGNNFTLQEIRIAPDHNVNCITKIFFNNLISKGYKASLEQDKINCNDNIEFHVEARYLMIDMASN